MKHKGLCLTIVISLTLLFSAMIAYAAPTVELSAQSVVIKGEYAQDKFVSIWVLRNGVSTADIAANGADMNLVAYGGQMYADESGYVFDFAMRTSDATGTYTVVIGGEDSANNTSFSMKYVSPTDIDNVYLPKINSMTAVELADMLSTDKYAYTAFRQLGCDTDFLEKLPSDNERIIWLRTFVNEKPFTRSDISNKFAANDVVYKLNNRTDKYAELDGKLGLLIDDDICSTYEGIYDAVAQYETSFNEYMTVVTSIADATEKVKEGLALTLLNNTRWGAMATTLNTYSQAFPFGYSDYSKLTDQQCKNLAGKNFTSLKNAEEALDDDSSSENESKGGSSGSRGGGTGGSFGAVVQPNNNYMYENVVYDTAFNDLGEAEWAREYIISLSERGIVNGTGNGSFSPNDFITREQFAKMLVVAFDIKADNSENAFSDVPDGHWASEYINTAHSAGIVSGIGNSEFGLGRLISRQDLVTMAERTFKTVGVEPEVSELKFDDAHSISDYAKDAVSAFFGLGIVNGKGDNRFEPQNSATRAECAKIIYMMLEILK